MMQSSEEPIRLPYTQSAIPLARLWLALACVLLYSKFLGNPWSFDDMYMFGDDKMLRAYSEKLFFDFNLRWFSYVTFGWTYNFFGTDLFWHRVVNLALHATVVLGLYAFLKQLFTHVLQGEAAGNENAARAAFWGALLFAVHPLSVYGEGYLIERSIVMATLFSILAMHAFLMGLSGKGHKWYFLAAAWYFVAVFSKEHAVMLPLALLALIPLVRNDYRTLVRELLIPFIVYFSISLLVVLKAKGILGTPYEQHAMEMLSTIAKAKGETGTVTNAFGLSILLQGYLFFKYLMLWMVPNVNWMSIDLQQQFPGAMMQWPETIGLLAYIGYPVLVGRLIFKGGKKGLLGYALIFPWIMFFTEFSTVRMVETFVLYRSYLWMISMPVALPILLGKMDSKRENGVLVAIVLVLAVLAWNRLNTFTNDLRLWEDVVAKLPKEKTSGMYRAYLNRGVANATRGQNSEALEDLNRAVELNPKSTSSLVSRGALKNNMGRFNDAYADLTQASEIDPRYAGAYANRALSQFNLGNRSMGFDDIYRALEIEPDNKNYRKILKWAIENQ